MEDERLEGWKVQMVAGQGGHWLFPIVEAFIELATPTGQASPISASRTQPATVVGLPDQAEQTAEKDPVSVSHTGNR